MQYQCFSQRNTAKGNFLKILFYFYVHNLRNIKWDSVHNYEQASQIASKDLYLLLH